MVNDASRSIVSARTGLLPDVVQRQSLRPMSVRGPSYRPSVAKRTLRARAEAKAIAQSDFIGCIHLFVTLENCREFYERSREPR